MKMNMSTNQVKEMAISSDQNKKTTKIHENLFFSFYLQDTRTHVVVELFNTEKSYVDSLETIVKVSRFIKS